MGPCPREACLNEDRVKAGSPQRHSFPRGREHPHFMSGVGYIVRGRIPRRAGSEDSKDCRQMDRERGAHGWGRRKPSIWAATFLHANLSPIKQMAFWPHELMLGAWGLEGWGGFWSGEEGCLFSTCRGRAPPRLIGPWPGAQPSALWAKRGGSAFQRHRVLQDTPGPAPTLGPQPGCVEQWGQMGYSHRMEEAKTVGGRRGWWACLPDI